jgi:hypothetical protein
MTISQTEFFNIVRKFKTEIKDSSVKSYASTLYKIQEQDFNMKDEKSVLNFFNNIDELFKKKEKNKDKPISYYYKKNNLVAINIYLQSLSIDTTEIKKKIYELKMEHELKGNVKSDKDKKNWVKKKTLLKIYNRLFEVVKTLGINKKKIIKLSNVHKMILQDYLILSLYLIIPPRRNVYANTKFITSKLFNALDNDEKENGNYLVYTNRNKQIFSFGDWKNSNTTGRTILNVPTPLRRVITLWVRYNRDKINNYMLTNISGVKMTPNSLTKKLNRLFASTGKKIGSTMIRKIMVSENEAVKAVNDNIKEAEKLAHDMGHSRRTQDQYYYKKDDDEKK